MSAKVKKNYELVYYDNWRGVSNEISIARLNDGLESGALEWLGTDKISDEPLEFLHYIYRSSARDCGMGSVIIYHMTNDVHLELGIIVPISFGNTV